MKIIIRSIIIYLIIGYILAFIIGPYSFRASAHQMKDWLLFIGGILWLCSYFFLWGYSFYNWGISSFKTKTLKIFWFWIILIGGSFLFGLGPLAYYLLVYEMGKGIAKKEIKVA